jgi:hypothetical protein
MAKWSDLKAAIAKIIKTNGNQEITGQLLQNVLNSIVSSVGENSTFAGIATPSTNPGTPDGNVFYLATRVGTYANFNGIAIADGEAVILEWKGSWTKKVTGFATQEQFSKIEKRGREITLADDLKNTNKSLRTDGTLKDTSSWLTYYKVPITKGDSFIADFSLIPTSEGTTACVIYNSNGAVTETINEKKIDYTFTQDGFISFCFYVYGSNNFYNIYSFRHLNNTIKQIVDGESLYNLDYRKPLSGSYYTATTARSAVPTNIRKFGLIITYKTDATTSVTEQFVGSSTSAWTTASNWKNIGASEDDDVVKNQVRQLQEFPPTLPWFDRFGGNLSDVTADLSLIGRTLKDIWFEFPDGKPSWWDSRQPQLRAYNGYGFGEENDARFVIYFRESKEETYSNTYNYQYRGPRYKGGIEYFRLAIKLGGRSEPTFYMNVVIDTLLLMAIDGTILSSKDSQNIQPMILKNTGTLYDIDSKDYVEEAPKDDKEYVRKNGTWAVATAQNIGGIPQIFNVPIRRRDKSEKLRLLCFGSSWNMCAWWYLNKIIQSAGINAEITGFYTGGAYFSQWIDRYKNNEAVDCWKSTNGSDWEKTTANFKDTLNEGWDIIEFQQGAYQAIKWEQEWEPYWSELVSIVKRNCNFDTIIAFNCSYTPGVNGNLSPYPKSQDGQKQWQQLNYENTQKFMALSGIYNVSPGGATMWSLRREPTINTEDAKDLASDNLHPDNGLPIYALGGTLFETYIAPMYGVSFTSVEWKPDTSIAKTPFNFGYQEMSNDQREKVRNIVKLSLSNRFGFNEL